MNILLLDNLPTAIDKIPISSDFRNMIQFDMALRDEDMNESERLWVGLRLLYPGCAGEIDKHGNPYPAPHDMNQAVTSLLWFFQRDPKPAKDEADSRDAHGRAYDFEQDAGMIYAAFSESYGILLAECKYMHWWAFMNLLEGLPENTRMARAMYFRTVDTAGMGKEERRHVMNMRRIFEIKTKTDELSPEERERKLKERINQKIAKTRR